MWARRRSWAPAVQLGMLDPSPSRLGGWVRGPASAGPLPCHQVAGLVMVMAGGVTVIPAYLLARLALDVTLHGGRYRIQPAHGPGTRRT